MPSLTPLHLVGLFIVTFAIALAAFEGGFSVGRRRSRLADPEAQQPVRTLVASMLNLLAFVAGFTFGLAASHFDVRNQSILDETIAIRSAYRRADFLPDPERTEMKRLLRDYVDVRLEVAKADTVEQPLERLKALQEKIWALAVGAQAKNVGPGFTPLAQSLTDVLDVHTWRVLAGFQSRIAPAVWVILYFLMVIAAGAAGY